MASRLLLARDVKYCIILIVIVACGTSLFASKPIPALVCQLALENIALINKAERPENWFIESAIAIDGGWRNLIDTLVRRVPPNHPTLNAEYFILKNKLLNNIFIRAKKRTSGDFSEYIIAQIPPRAEDTLMEYVSKYAAESAAKILEANYDNEVVVLNSVNHFLNVIAAHEPALIYLLLAELEVQHPKEYEEFKNSSEVQILYNLSWKIEEASDEVDRLFSLHGEPSPKLKGAIMKKADLLSTFATKRLALYNRLLNEDKLEELYATEAMFGSDI